MTNPIHYVKLYPDSNGAGMFNIPIGSLIMNAVYLFDELRIYYQSDRKSLSSKNYKYQIVGTGNQPDSGMSYLYTYCPDNHYVWHLFVEDSALSNYPVQKLEEIMQTILTSESPNAKADSKQVHVPTVISADEHRGASFLYQKMDGTTRLMRLSHVEFGVGKNGRQTLSGYDADKHEMRTVYLDHVLEWAQIN